MKSYGPLPEPLSESFPRKHKVELRRSATAPKADPAPKPADPVPEPAKPDEQNRPFRPVSPDAVMMCPEPVVARVMLRQLDDMKGQPPPASSAFAVMEKLEAGLKNGQDISGLAPEISHFITGEEEHNELFSRLHNALDRERMMNIFRSRTTWEDFCHACLQRGDLTIIEGMAMMNYFNTQLTSIYGRLEKRVRGDMSAMRESGELVEKVNRPSIAKEKELQRKFDEAPPQEREILRKIGFRLENALAARITKTTETTETQTVEIIQQPDGTR